jgi:hypothetical protein
MNSIGSPDVRFGSQADICGAIGHVRFTPDCDRESGLSKWAMFALPPKADMALQEPTSALGH